MLRTVFKPTRSVRSWGPALCVLCLAWLTAAPGWAYIVVLKDGKQITTSKKYERQGDEVILTLPNGVTSSILAADVDFEKTEDLNKSSNLSNARLLEAADRNQGREVGQPKEPEELTFTDLLSNRKKLALPEPKKRAEANESEEAAPTYPTTKAGFVDLMNLRRESHPNADLVTEIVGYLTSQGNTVKVHQGSQENWPLVEMTAASEASVFKAIKDASSCLVQMRQQFSGLDGFELLIVTETQIRAGQFSLDQERANELLTGRMEAPSFFLRYVEF